MDFVTGLFTKAKEAVSGTPTTAPASVTDGYPAPVGARRGKRKGGKKTRKGGKSRRKTARRV